MSSTQLHEKLYEKLREQRKSLLVNTRVLIEKIFYYVINLKTTMNCMNLLLVILAIIVIVVVLKKMNNKEGFDQPNIGTHQQLPAYDDMGVMAGEGGNDYSDLVGEYY